LSQLRASGRHPSAITHPYAGQRPVLQNPSWRWGAAGVQRPAGSLSPRAEWPTKASTRRSLRSSVFNAFETQSAQSRQPPAIGNGMDGGNPMPARVRRYGKNIPAGQMPALQSLPCRPGGCALNLSLSAICRCVLSGAKIHHTEIAKFLRALGVQSCPAQRTQRPGYSRPAVLHEKAAGLTGEPWATNSAVLRQKAQVPTAAPNRLESALVRQLLDPVRVGVLHSIFRLHKSV